MSWIRRIAIAALVTVGLVGSAGQSASAAGPINDISISGQATIWGFVPSVNGVFVNVTALCAGGIGTVSVTVIQAASNNSGGVPASGTDTHSVRCDGTRVKVSVSVLGTGSFNQGTATATATLTAPSGTATDTQTVRISGP